MSPPKPSTPSVSKLDQLVQRIPQSTLELLDRQFRARFVEIIEKWIGYL